MSTIHSRSALGMFTTTLFLALIHHSEGADFTYWTNWAGDGILVTGYTGRGGLVKIPETISGLPVREIVFDFPPDTTRPDITGLSIPGTVTSIRWAFYGWTGLSTVTIPKSVNDLDMLAFGNCPNLRTVYFCGDAPTFNTIIGGPPFWNSTNVTCYYLPGTKWDTQEFCGMDCAWLQNAGVPVVLWNPQIRPDDPRFGAHPEGFGLPITGTTNIPIIIESAGTALGPSWTTLHSCTLTNGSLYLQDPDWTNYPARFYRIRSP